MCWEIQERRRTSQHAYWPCRAIWWYCRELHTGRTWLEVGVQIGRTAHGEDSWARSWRSSQSFPDCKRAADSVMTHPPTFGLLLCFLYFYISFLSFSFYIKEKRHQKIKTSIKCPPIILVIFLILCSLKISYRNAIYLGCIDSHALLPTPTRS